MFKMKFKKDNILDWFDDSGDDDRNKEEENKKDASAKKDESGEGKGKLKNWKFENWEKEMIQKDKEFIAKVQQDVKDKFTDSKSKLTVYSYKGKTNFKRNEEILKIKKRLEKNINKKVSLGY